MDLLKEAQKYSEEQLLQMLALRQAAGEIERLEAELAAQRKAIQGIEKKLARKRGREKATRAAKPTAKKKPAQAAKPKRKKGGRRGRTGLTLKDAVLKALADLGKDARPPELPQAVVAAGYQTGANPKNLQTQVYRVLSDLAKEKKVVKTRAGGYRLRAR